MLELTKEHDEFRQLVRAFAEHEVPRNVVQVESRPHTSRPLWSPK